MSEMGQQPPAFRRRPGRRGCLRQLLVLAIILVFTLLFLFGGDYLLRVAYAPWSLPGEDGRTLTGSWAGPLRLEDGVTGQLVVTLSQSLDLEDSSDLNIMGAARYCLGAYAGEFELYGTADRQGSVEDLRFRAMEEDPVWLLHNVRSRWDGDTVTLTGTYSFDPTAQHIWRSDQPDPEVTMVLRPAAAGEVAAVCR